MVWKNLLIVCLGVILAGAGPTDLLSAQTPLTTVRVASGLSRPLFCTAPPGDLHRLFIVEQYTARIRILKNGSLLPTPFLDINALVTSSGNERGLLGLAFHPDYGNNGYFYVHYNNNAGTSTVARYQVSATNPDVANPTSAQIVLTQSQPYSNHNGGMLAFSPLDGYLYIGFGDGGSGYDPGNRSQNPSTWLGKMLRIDVDGGSPYAVPPGNPFVSTPGTLPEIWALGLRNPWRYSFDRATGDLYIGDVGQNAIEEIDFQPASSPGGENYGWRCMEGNNCTGLSGCICNSPSLTQPVHAYNHSSGCSVTGGYVYRGCAIPDLGGTYFFADYCNGRIWSFRVVAGTMTQFTERTAELAPGSGLTINSISSFGEDGHGELYIVDLGGEVFKIVPATTGASISLGALPLIGTTLDVNLSSPADPLKPYVCGFSAGTEPGILLPDLRRVPLNWDALLILSLDPLNTFFLNTVGSTLSVAGTATVQMVIPNDPVLIGLQMFAAFVVDEPTAPSGIGTISCALSLTIQ